MSTQPISNARKEQHVTSSTSAAAGTASNPDYDLPGNDLDPNNLTAEQRKTIPLIIRVYGRFAHSTASSRSRLWARTSESSCTDSPLDRKAR